MHCWIYKKRKTLGVIQSHDLVSSRSLEKCDVLLCYIGSINIYPVHYIDKSIVIISRSWFQLRLVFESLINLFTMPPFRLLGNNDWNRKCNLQSYSSKLISYSCSSLVNRSRGFNGRLCPEHVPDRLRSSRSLPVGVSHGRDGHRHGETLSQSNLGSRPGRHVI